MVKYLFWVSSERIPPPSYQSRFILNISGWGKSSEVGEAPREPCECLEQTFPSITLGGLGKHRSFQYNVNANAVTKA